MDTKHGIPPLAMPGYGIPYVPYVKPARFGVFLVVVGSIYIVHGILVMMGTATSRPEQIYRNIAAALGSIAAGAVLIAAVNTKQQKPVESRRLFITSIVLYSLSVLSNLAGAIFCLIEVQALSTARTQLSDDDNTFAMYIFLAAAILLLVGAVFAVVVIALSVLNLRNSN